ncbi:hypothetical protein SCHPADRAFT_947135 [Schizopora paradoxa]|uniref:Uncharacterized protein n=1 Tax=Schizopora paradoxa TaxID=27342 RepID=A0A0H2R1E9_9AGAM|nr:hypothetical protein SCHPADRAFT_947135 [Schizopora paradoxa]
MSVQYSVPHRGSKSSNAVVKLVLQRPNKQLKSIQKQLCASAKDLASQLSKISTLVDEVQLQLLREGERTRGEENDVSEMQKDWRAISKLHTTYLKDLRTMAVSGPVTIDDFLCEFTDYMCSASDTIEMKREEAQKYSNHLLSETKQTNDGMRNFISLAQNVRGFRACWADSNSYSISVDSKCASIIEKLESITNVRPSNDVAAMLDNVSFPGVESASMTILPSQYATQLYKLLEGERTSKVETLRKQSDATPVNVLSVFLGVCLMLIKDLNAVDEAIQCHTGNRQLGVLKAKLGIVYSSYSSMSDALKVFSRVLAGVTPNDSKSRDGKPMERFKKWCILLLKRD